MPKYRLGQEEWFLDVNASKEHVCDCCMETKTCQYIVCTKGPVKARYVCGRCICDNFQRIPEPVKECNFDMRICQWCGAELSRTSRTCLNCRRWL